MHNGSTYEVQPEPEPDEAAALATALARALEDDPLASSPPAYRSRWRRIGVEALIDERRGSL